MNDGTDGFESALSDILEVQLCITLFCPVGCRFCNKRSSPSRNETMTKEQIWNIIDQSVELFPDLELISISGGEPLTKPDLVRCAVDRATEYKIPSAVATSAWWATSYKIAVDILRDLRTRGLFCVMFSTDDEKRLAVPMDRVAHAVRAAQNLIIPFTVACHSRRNKMTPPFYQQWSLVQALKYTEPLRADYFTRINGKRRFDWHPQQNTPLSFEFTDGGPIAPIFKNDFTYGQQRLSFDELAYKGNLESQVLRRFCRTIVAFNPGGDCWWCWFKLGNLKDGDGDLKGMIQTAANSWMYPIWKEGGPVALARAVDEELGSHLCDRKYVNLCHICARIWNVIDWDGSPKKQQLSS